jgi:hypothetical protein
LIFYALQPHLNPSDTSLGQVPEAGSGQALQGGGRKVKNEVGALATSIIYQPKAFSIADFGFKFFQLPLRTERE